MLNTDITDPLTQQEKDILGDWSPPKAEHFTGLLANAMLMCGIKSPIRMMSQPQESAAYFTGFCDALAVAAEEPGWCSGIIRNVMDEQVQATGSSGREIRQRDGFLAYIKENPLESIISTADPEQAAA